MFDVVSSPPPMAGSTVWQLWILDMIGQHATLRRNGYRGRCAKLASASWPRELEERLPPSIVIVCNANARELMHVGTRWSSWEGDMAMLQIANE